MTTTPEHRPTSAPSPSRSREADLDDLQSRLARTRFAVAAPGDGWDYGIPTAYLRDMVAAVAGVRLARPGGPDERRPAVRDRDRRADRAFRPRPVGASRTRRRWCSLHTYPGSFAEFLDMIGPLTDPVAHGGRAEDAFHVVIPSMPGFGFSTPLVDGGWTMARVARTWDVLMRRLGYDIYGTHGSDGGAMVSRELAMLNPEGFLGAHVLQLFSFPSGDPAEFEKFGPKEYAALEFVGWFQSVGGYNQMNGSRPQTVARRAGRLTGRAAGLERAVRDLRQRDQPGLTGADPHPGHPVLADQHLGHRGPLPLRGGPLRRRAGRSATAGPGSRSSRTTSRRSGRWPSGTTPTSCTGPSTTAAATSPRWRCPRWSSPTCGCSSVRPVRPGSPSAAELVDRRGDDPVDELLAGRQVVDDADHLARGEHAGAVSPSTRPALSIIGVFAASAICARVRPWVFASRGRRGRAAASSSRSPLELPGPAHRGPEPPHGAGLLELLDERRAQHPVRHAVDLGGDDGAGQVGAR